MPRKKQLIRVGPRPTSTVNEIPKQPRKRINVKTAKELLRGVIAPDHFSSPAQRHVPTNYPRMIRRGKVNVKTTPYSTVAPKRKRGMARGA